MFRLTQQRRRQPAALVCLLALLACLPLPATASTADPASPAATSTALVSATEPLACVIFDAQAPAWLALDPAQLERWRSLQQTHDALFDDACSTATQPQMAASHPQASRPLSHVLHPSPGFAANPETQRFTHEFTSLLDSLNSKQRSRLAALGQARQTARQQLAEKILWHRLIL
jgi:hypothetical protein